MTRPETLVASTSHCSTCILTILTFGSTLCFTNQHVAMSLLLARTHPSGLACKRTSTHDKGDSGEPGNVRQRHAVAGLTFGALMCRISKRILHLRQ